MSSAGNARNNRNNRTRIWINRISVLLLLALLVAFSIFLGKYIQSKKTAPVSTPVIISNTTPTADTTADSSSAPATPGVPTDPDITPDTTDNRTTDSAEPTEAPEITAVPATDVPEDPTAVPTATPTRDPYSGRTPVPGEPYTEITVINAGDIMFHMAQVRGAYDAATDSYDFHNTFKYITDIVSRADLAVANFETTLHDTEYSGFPGFNSPVSTLSAIKDAGFDVMLYANNHCFDRRLEGLQNTLAHFREYGFSYLGATDDPDNNDKTLIKTVGGVRIGMLNYTDSVSERDGNTYTLNGNHLTDAECRYLNIYVHNYEETTLYGMVETDVASLRSRGVDIIIAYMHWGNEYELTENAHQRAIAQKLCDLGVDVIIGGHPHVVQPMDILTSSDGSHQMICFYSLGNYVSNQNRLTLSSYDVREYTENGLMVQLTIRKYESGYTEVCKLECIPTWVHRYKKDNGYYNHEIIPLPVSDDAVDYYGLTKTDFGVSHARQSFERTNSLFEERIKAFNQGQ